MIGLTPNGPLPREHHVRPTADRNIVVVRNGFYRHSRRNNGRVTEPVSILCAGRWLKPVRREARRVYLQ